MHDSASPKNDHEPDASIRDDEVSAAPAMDREFDERSEGESTGTSESYSVIEPISADETSAEVAGSEATTDPITSESGESEAPRTDPVTSSDESSASLPDESAEGGSTAEAEVRSTPQNDAASEPDESASSESASGRSSSGDPELSSEDEIAVEDVEAGRHQPKPEPETTAKASSTVWYMPEPSDRPLPWLSWRYSLIFVVALIGVIATAAYEYATQPNDTPKELVFRVTDPGGSPIEGATIRLGQTIQTTDTDGIAHLPQGVGAQPISVERDGYTTVEGTVDPANGDRREIVLQPAPTPTGPSSAPASPAATASNSTPTGSEGTSVAILDLANDDHTQGLGARELAGKVLDPNGTPIQGARVNAGSVWSVTGADGIYFLHRATIDIHQPIHIFAAGYVDADITVPPLGDTIDVTLHTRTIKAIYLNPTVTNTQDEIDALIAIANTTEINAFVIDIKEEVVFYDSQVALFRDAGTIDPILDLPALLDQLHANGIYTIARLVVFKDSFVAEKRPDLAIRSTETGDAWRDQNGVAWVNPMKQELWEANTALAVEAANLGFDEIQFDYVRFPTDGDLSTMDFGAANDQANRERTITDFVDYAWQRIIPTGAKLSADVFGYTLMVQDDLGIGQNLNLLASHLDYLSPMVYPSHYGQSFQGYSPPVDYPGEVVGVTLNTGLASHDLAAKKLRPWLQDFDYSANDRPYGAKEVRAQIDAAEAAGASGWMLWTLGNPITVDALKPESGSSNAPGSNLAALFALAGVAYDPRSTSGLA